MSQRPRILEPDPRRRTLGVHQLGEYASQSSRLSRIIGSARDRALLHSFREDDVELDGPRLRALVDSYRLDLARRRVLTAQYTTRTRERTNFWFVVLETGSSQQWARMFAEGHADYWGPAAAYIEEHHDAWVTALVSDYRSPGEERRNCPEPRFHRPVLR